MERKETLIVVILGVVVAALVVFVYYYTESTGRISYGDWKALGIILVVDRKQGSIPTLRGL